MVNMQQNTVYQLQCSIFSEYNCLKPDCPWTNMLTLLCAVP